MLRGNERRPVAAAPGVSGRENGRWTLVQAGQCQAQARGCVRHLDLSYKSLERD